MQINLDRRWVQPGPRIRLVQCCCKFGAVKTKLVCLHRIQRAKAQDERLAYDDLPWNNRLRSTAVGWGEEVVGADAPPKHRRVGDRKKHEREMEISHGLSGKTGSPTQADESLFIGGGPAISSTCSVAAWCEVTPHDRLVRFFPVGDRPVRGPGSGNYSRVVKESEHSTSDLRDWGRKALTWRCSETWVGWFATYGQKKRGLLQGHLTASSLTARDSKPGVRSPGYRVLERLEFVGEPPSLILVDRSKMPHACESGKKQRSGARSLGRNVSPASNVRPGSDTRLGLPSSLEA